MAPTPLAYVYCTQQDVNNVLSVNGVDILLDDHGDGAVNSVEQGRMTDAIARAAETCNFYLYWKYDPANLAAYSNLTNQLAADLAAYVLARARGNAVPQSLITAATEAKDMLNKIMLGRATLPAVPMRRWQAPTWDNIRVDMRYHFKVIRVEQNTSSQMPMTRPVNIDWAEQFSYEI